MRSCRSSRRLRSAGLKIRRHHIRLKTQLKSNARQLFRALCWRGRLCRWRGWLCSGLSYLWCRCRRFGAVACGAGAAVDVEDDAAAFLLFFLIKLRTVSEGCAPREIQCSTRSSFNPLL